MASRDIVIQEQRTAQALERRRSYGLPPDVLRFVLDYVTDFDSERAYISTWAALGDRSENRAAAAKIIVDPNVLDAMVQEVSAQGEALTISGNFIKARLVQEALEMGSKPRERMKALELLARMNGMLDPEPGRVAPSVHITISDPQNVQVSRS